MTTPLRVLNPPAVESVRYSTNFIHTAVCELRFPTLLELEATPPRAFQAKIRKSYPHYEAQVIDAMGPVDEVAREHRYLFRSKDGHWTVSVKSFAISLETSKYVDFEDFYQRLSGVLANAREMIDADFYTRVGLRYINWVPIERGDPTGWIQEQLIAPIAVGVLGDAARFAARVQGMLPNGGHYMFRHGLKERDDAAGPPQHYLLDYDYFSENVDADAAIGLVKEFNKINFSLFSWSLGPKAKEKLGTGKGKNR